MYQDMKRQEKPAIVSHNLPSPCFSQGLVALSIYLFIIDLYVGTPEGGKRERGVREEEREKETEAERQREGGRK